MSDQLSNAFFIFDEQHNGTADTRKLDDWLRFNQFRSTRKDQEMMMQILIPNVLGGLGTLFSGLSKPHEPKSDSDSTPEFRRAERDLVNEMIWSHPDAFGSGSDVECMMRMRGGRF